jgi:hypothetical protein
VSKHEKLIQKLLEKRKTMTYSELKSLLSGFGYEEDTKGKTSGSRISSINQSTKHLIRLHKPHPGNELKRYIKALVLEELKKEGLIK